ncbi:MAG: hypothetical protein WCS86_01695 [Candidatus Paceibacterota bacterium]
MNRTVVASSLKVRQIQFNEFGEIVRVGGFNAGIYSHLEQNSVCKNAILAPVFSTEEEELFLYWEGKDQVIPGGKDIYDYFASQGYEVVEKAHPSLLVNAMAVLTEERLAELGIPSNVNIVLPTSVSLLPVGDGRQCFLSADRSDGYRRLSLVSFDGEWHGGCAFLLRKKKA